MPPPHLLETLFDRPIAFHRVFAKFTGSLNAGLMLSQAVFWSKRTRDAEGWFYKSQSQWEDEVCLTRREQDTARLALRRLRRLPDGQPLPQFWFEERRGIPARLYYRVDMDALFTHLKAYHASDAQKRQTGDDVQPDLTVAPSHRHARKRQTRLAENAKLDVTKAPNRVSGKRQTGLAENANHSLQRLHAKNTAKSSSSRRTHTRTSAAASRFTETQILDFLDDTKPHNKARNHGLAHKLYLSAEDDHLIERWLAKRPKLAADPNPDSVLLESLELADGLLRTGIEYDWQRELIPNLITTLTPSHSAVADQLKGLQ